MHEVHDLRLNKRVLVSSLIPCSDEGPLVAHPARHQLGPDGGRERLEDLHAFDPDLLLDIFLRFRPRVDALYHVEALRDAP